MSSILTNKARIRQTKFLHDSELFLAWGNGITSWGTDREVTDGFDILLNTLDVGYPYISAVTVRLAVDDTPYEIDVDFTVNAATGVLTRLVTGSIPLGQDVIVGFHVNVAPESVASTELVSEVGRRRVTNKAFVVPDNGGDILVESGTFSLSPLNAPTNHLFLEAVFHPSEASDQTIREVAVFADVEIETGLPGGQQYFVPAEIADAGTIITLSNLPSIVRNATSRETFRLVITL